MKLIRFSVFPRLIPMDDGAVPGWVSDAAQLLEPAARRKLNALCEQMRQHHVEDPGEPLGMVAGWWRWVQYWVETLWNLWDQTSSGYGLHSGRLTRNSENFEELMIEKYGKNG